jgi:hypothetical protein
MMDANVPPKREFYQEPHGVTSHKTTSFSYPHQASSSGASLSPLYLQRKSEGAILLLHDNGTTPTVFFRLA